LYIAMIMHFDYLKLREIICEKNVLQSKEM